MDGEFDFHRPFRVIRAAGRNGPTIVKWPVRPGGLVAIAYDEGKTIYLARELACWRGNAELAHPPERPIRAVSDWRNFGSRPVTLDVRRKENGRV